jgi:CheY-like chemotaxis protein
MLKVIFADDDEDDRELFNDAVKETALVVSLVMIKSGNDLMKKLNSLNFDLPDIIFLDLNMPQKSGNDCLKEIRSADKLKDIPVIIYSTSCNCTEIEMCFKEGANLYVQKPDSFSDLVLVIKKILLLGPAGLIRTRKEKFVLRLRELKS